MKKPLFVLLDYIIKNDDDLVSIYLNSDQATYKNNDFNKNRYYHYSIIQK